MRSWNQVHDSFDEVYSNNNYLDRRIKKGIERKKKWKGFETRKGQSVIQPNTTWVESIN